MANPPCMSQDGNPAVFVGTMLATGDAVALCDECMVPWAAALLNAMTGVDPTPFLVAISDDVAVVDFHQEDLIAPHPVPTNVEPDPMASSGNTGRSRRASRGRGTADARSDDERAADADRNTPAA
jgi:hypothetical protein